MGRKAPCEDATIAASLKKEVHVLKDGVQTGLVQGLWLDRETGQVRPNVCILDAEGNVLLQTNDLGLRGPDVREGDRIGVVWGDSVVWGVLGSDWPEKMNEMVSGCTFLNGGLEGSDYNSVLERAVRFNELHAVRVNVLFPGWHTVGDNSRFRADLIEALRYLPNVLVLTMPTSLNPTIATSDISSHFTNIRPTYQDIHADRFFGFFGTEPYSLAFQAQLFQHIIERNDLIRDAAQKLRLPILDLFEIMNSSALDKFNEYFFDMSHPRPRTYAMIASLVSKAAANLIDRPSQQTATPTDRRSTLLAPASPIHASSSSSPLLRLQKHRTAKRLFAATPETHNDGLCEPSHRGGVWNVRAPGPQWSYAASWAKIGDIPDDGPIIVEVDVAVDEGKVGFGLVAVDESYVGKERTAFVSPEATTITLKAEDSSRIRYLVLRNVDEIGATAVARVSAIRAYTARYVPATLCLLYQPEKTGSQTLEASIKATDEDAIVERHHFLSRQTLNKFEHLSETCLEWSPEIDSYRNQLRLSRRASDLLKRHDPEATCILMGIRDPLERALSAFFQHIGFLCPDLTFAEERLQYESAEVISRFAAEFEAFLKRKNANEAPSDLRTFLLDRTMQNLDDWLSDELSAVFGIGVPSMRIPRSGFVKLRHRRRTFYFYKVGALASSLPAMLQSLFPAAKVKAVNQNLSREKPYGKLYDRTKSEFVPTASMMRYYYENSAAFSRSFSGQDPVFNAGGRARSSA